MTILGIGGILNDAAVAVVRDGKLVAAIEQLKLTRLSRPGELPLAALHSALAMAGVKLDQVDCVALVRPLGIGREDAGPGTDLHLALRALLPKAHVILVDHHTAHAASAFYASPFEKATVLTLDRGGDLRCGALWRGAGTELRVENELYFADSLGDLYGRVTALLGFDASSEEHKVQWLSASGTDKLVPLFRAIIGEGWPRVDRSFFDGHRPARGGFSSRFYEAVGLSDGAPIPAQMRADVARGMQGALEQTVIDMAGTGENLALAGGLALNVLLVAALERSGRWKNVFVQPAAGNSGTSIGAALHAWHNHHNQTARVELGGLLLGPAFSPEETKQVLENCKLDFRYLLTTSELIVRAVEELTGNKIIAWMHGRMEFGPRALGNRSILASPMNPYSTENLNHFIKHREGFRKFAASVPAELADKYFETGPNARYLSTVSRIRPEFRDRFDPAVLGEGWIRVHTVHKEDNLLYWELLHAFGKATGLPVLYNTSFNLFGDPLVCSPRDAVRSFYSSGIDSLFCGQFLLQK
jgi:carbamoyltransferase